MAVVRRLRCMDTRGRAIIRTWDRPSYGAAKLGDGHLQTPHCRHWRQHTAVGHAVQLRDLVEPYILIANKLAVLFS